MADGQTQSHLWLANGATPPISQITREISLRESELGWSGKFFTSYPSTQITGDETKGQKGFMMVHDQREAVRAGPRLQDSLLTQRAIRPVTVTRE